MDEDELEFSNMKIRLSIEYKLEFERIALGLLDETKIQILKTEKNDFHIIQIKNDNYETVVYLKYFGYYVSKFHILNDIKINIEDKELKSLMIDISKRQLLNECAGYIVGLI